MSRYTTYDAIRIYRDWAERGKLRCLAAARYWLQYGIGESGCDHGVLRDWLDRWYDKLRPDEQRALDDWMERTARAIIAEAPIWAARQQERREQIARAQARWARMSDSSDELPDQTVAGADDDGAA